MVMDTSPLPLNPVVRRPVSRSGPRVTRQPKMPFSLIWKPYVLQPCCIFPVLPGETLTNVSLMMQFWSDPLKAAYKNTPWYMEYFLFSVPFKAFPGWAVGETGLGAELITMIEAGTPIASVDADGNAVTYCPPGGADFVLEATKAIAEQFFRESGQAWDAKTVDGLPAAHAFAGRHEDVLRKLTDAAEIGDRSVAIGGNVGWDQIAQMMDFAAARDRDEVAGGNVMAMDYEDIIRAMGGRVNNRPPDREQLHRVELLAYLRHFDYPVNTVEPSTGIPAVMFGHRFKHRYNKAYRFEEPGFLVGLVCVRPKNLWKNQQGLFTAMLLGRNNWFMPNEDGMTAQSHLIIDDDTGPLTALTGTPNVNYAVDVRDLFTMGEQFVNYAPDQAKDAFATLPEADFDRDYPADGDVLSAFTDTTNGRYRGNGVVNISVKTYPAVVGVGQPRDRQLTEWSDD